MLNLCLLLLTVVAVVCREFWLIREADLDIPKQCILDTVPNISVLQCARLCIIQDQYTAVLARDKSCTIGSCAVQGKDGVYLVKYRPRCIQSQDAADRKYILTKEDVQYVTDAMNYCTGCSMRLAEPENLAAAQLMVQLVVKEVPPCVTYFLGLKNPQDKPEPIVTYYNGTKLDYDYTSLWKPGDPNNPEQTSIAIRFDHDLSPIAWTDTYGETEPINKTVKGISCAICEFV